MIADSTDTRQTIADPLLLPSFIQARIQQVAAEPGLTRKSRSRTKVLIVLSDRYDWKQGSYGGYIRFVLKNQESNVSVQSQD